MSLPRLFNKNSNNSIRNLDEILVFLLDEKTSPMQKETLLNDVTESPELLEKIFQKVVMSSNEYQEHRDAVLKIMKGSLDLLRLSHKGQPTNSSLDFSSLLSFELMKEKLQQIDKKLYLHIELLKSLSAKIKSEKTITPQNNTI